MESWLNSLWQTLCQNVVFLMALVPFFGAGLVLAVSSAGQSVIRRAALSNACLTLALAVLLVTVYDPRLTRAGRLVTIQCTTVLRWAALDGAAKNMALFHFATGTDGLNLWFLVTSAALAIPALSAPVPMRRLRRGTTDAGSSEEDSSGAAAYYSLLLCAEGLLLFAFAALDVILFSMCILASVLPLGILCGLWGGIDRREATRRFFLGHLAGGMLITAGLLGLVASNLEREQRTATSAESSEPTFFLVRTLESPQTANTRQDRARQAVTPPLMILLLAGGATLMTPLAGRHGHWLSFARELPDGPRVLLLSGLLTLGVYVFLRTLAPLIPDRVTLMAATPMLMACINAAWVQLRTRRKGACPITGAVLTYACLACAGGLSHKPGALAGGVVLMMSVAGCAAVLAFSQESSIALSVNQERWPALSGYFGTALFRAALSALPGFGVLSGLWMMLTSALDQSDAAVSQVPVAIVFTTTVASIVISLACRNAAQIPQDTLPTHESAKTDFLVKSGNFSDLHEARIYQRLYRVGIAVVLIAIGLAPGFFSNRVLPSCFRTLHQTMPASASRLESD